MKVLLFGSQGWIGGQFVRLLLQNDIQFILAVSRADNVTDVIKEINDNQPSHVVSFIGISCNYSSSSEILEKCSTRQF